MYALSAATISHTIARACTSGDLRLCSCSPIPGEIPEPGIRWGGCGDNLHYGLMMGSKFSDAPMKMKRAGSHANKLMHLHNSEVGRQVRTWTVFFLILSHLYECELYLNLCLPVKALRDALVMKCKCHGVSGSCSTRTCWRGLQDLREIAMDLKIKYLSATKVVHRPMGTRKQLVPKDIDIRPVRENELVYLQSSPDFCTKNDKHGSVGTQDRWDVAWSWLSMNKGLFGGYDNSLLFELAAETNRKWPIVDVCSSRMLTLVKWRPVWWHRLVCRLADNSQWSLRVLRLWLVWACVSEKTSVTGVVVLLSEKLTNAVILRAECARADIDWRGPHKWGNS